MGITIHYKGKLKDVSKIDSVFNVLVQGAKINNIKEFWESEDDKVRMFSMNVDKGCETFSIGFDKKTGETKYRWKNKNGVVVIDSDEYFCKTQYSKDFIGTHIFICMTLKCIAPFFETFNVYDEGDFYETNNLQKLLENVEECNQVIDGIYKKLRDNFKNVKKVE